MSTDRTNFVTVFRTGQLVHSDWACNALEEAGIPYQRREETSGGLQVAMPVAPSVGPGTWWSIYVPQSSVATAHEVLASLPFDGTTTPDIWSFNPKPAGKLSWQIYAVIAISAIVIGIILTLLKVWR